MKIAMIGNSGHGLGFCLPESRIEDRSYVALAPGNTGESIDRAIQRLQGAGYTPKIYDDYGTLLREAKPDVVVVDNYYGCHGPVVKAALDAGCHVFSEKPLAANARELTEIEAAWHRAGTQLTAMFNYRYNGAFYSAYQQICAGAIGQVRLLNAQKSYKFGTRPEFMTKRATYGGTIPWVGIHGVDWIHWMSKCAFTSVTAEQSAMGAANGTCPEITALVQFQLQNQVMASLTIDYLNPATAKTHGDDRIRVVGTEGVIEVCRNTVVLTNKDGVSQPDRLPGKDADLFEDFLQQIRGTGVCRVSGADAITATRAALLAQESADSGKTMYF